MQDAIGTKVARFRQLLSISARRALRVHERAAVAGRGGNFDVNKEVAESAKAAIEKRFGSDQIFVLNPGTVDADLPNGSGADYMLMWTTLLEGPNGLGEDVDFVYFVGPHDFARYFGLDGNGDMAKIDRFYDARIKSNPGFEKATKHGLSETTFRHY